MSVADAQRELARALLASEAPTELAGTRLGTYRRLVRHNLDQVLRDLLPRTSSLLGERFWAEAAAFYEQQAPRTHYLRDVPGELVAWASERWNGDPTIARWASDLARYEIASHEASAAPGDEETTATAELSLDGPVVTADHVRALRLRYAVHEVSPGEPDASEPARRDVALVVYRDAEHELRFLELTPAAAAILDRLLGGAIVRSAITEGAAAAGVPVDDALLVGTSALLADLADRRVLLGGRR